MVFEYALVYVKYTIPPALLLTLIYRPLFTKLDFYKISSLILIVLLSTTPWDSRFIRTNIQTYPPTHGILEPKFLLLPMEEIFFFIVHAYNTSLIYLILSKPTFHPEYLRAERPLSHSLGPLNPQWRFYRLLGQVGLTVGIKLGWDMIRCEGRGVYLGLIVVWAGTFLLGLWSLAYQFILGLPLSNTVVPVLLPTLYLWVVDAWALRRWTWATSKETKSNFRSWDGLGIEYSFPNTPLSLRESLLTIVREAAFFLATSTLITFSQIAFDNALSVLSAFQNLYPNSSALPSPLLLVQALLLPASSYDPNRIHALQEAAERLQQKSQSLYIVSSSFQCRLRTEFLLLYSFCCVADNLVENAISYEEAKNSITLLRRYLGLSYGQYKSEQWRAAHIRNNFRKEAQEALSQLQPYLPEKSLREFVEGFEMDLAFHKTDSPAPIQTEVDLECYASRVGGSVARMCLELIFHNCSSQVDSLRQQHIVSAGERMGVALQYIKIARDIAIDAKIGRVYLPLTWIEEQGLTYGEVAKHPQGHRVEEMRLRLLDKAFKIYEEARGVIEELPEEVKAPMRVAVETYVETGRVLREGGYGVRDGKVVVPGLRRLGVAWEALRG
ncbi:Lycopene beta-cyclase [Delitschia confertaspora ATCC 74209]|uniref:Bifunctional lycopene cyclase/phytoene synthase n=1 Tax=Delitschia confertaspora ATCC 74209 TaxID=1513339 RepID=A0A9P4JGK0_9PLEO|nr:Lycopene beta-cyclase [Delitschia confertaspora ATCC 74209]